MSPDTASAKRQPQVLVMEYFLPAGDTDAQRRMPLWLFTSRIIEVATLHANALGIGYADLKPLGIGWVLSRLSIEIVRYPGINETYTMTTWIESFNRMFSNRCFLFTDAEGRPVAHVRSLWAAIDMNRRSAADLTVLPLDELPVGSRTCPLSMPAKTPRIAEADSVRSYTFAFCDCDLNRHVNTIQYIRQLLNIFPMEQYDSHEVARFDISFHKECRYGDTVEIRGVDTADGRSYCEILLPDGERAVACTIVWRPAAADNNAL